MSAGCGILGGWTDSLQPQQLRLANRLWPSDSVHLRRVLHIPLDQCHLPSSSSIERVSREEDGNLIVWAREPLQRRTTSSSLDGSTTDLLGAWEDTSGRSSLDSFRDPMVRANGKGKAPALLIDGEEIEELDAVSGYLPKTNNPYSFSAPPSPPLRNDLFGLYSPFNPSSAPTLALRTSEPPDPHSGPSSSTDSLGSNSSRPSPSSAGTLSRRTLTVERVPSSSLSFFPPPNPAFSNSSSTRSSYEETRSSIDEQALNSMFTGGSSTTRHTINTVAKSSARTKKFSLTPVTTAWSALAAGVASASDPVSSTTPSTGVDERQPGWMARWDLSYFGGEEEVELTAPGGETWRMPESSRSPQYAGAGADVTRSHTVKARREPRPE